MLNNSICPIDKSLSSAPTEDQREFESIGNERMRRNVIETFKMIDRTMADIYSTFFLKLEIYCQDRFQKLSLLTT